MPNLWLLLEELLLEGDDLRKNVSVLSKHFWQNVNINGTGTKSILTPTAGTTSLLSLGSSPMWTITSLPKVMQLPPVQPLPILRTHHPEKTALEVPTNFYVFAWWVVYATTPKQNVLLWLV